MTPHAEPPTDAEWRILKIVYEQGRCSSRDVIAAAAAHWRWSDSTVKTLLRRLCDKGHLLTRTVGSSLLYRPARPIQRALRASADQLIDRSVAGAMGPLLQYMVAKSNLSAAELATLRDLIDAHRAAGDRGER